MKILLNGATAGSNFGDFLFAKMFQEYIGEIVGYENVFWYDGPLTLSEFYKKHLGYKSRYKFREIDALVYISGGYFCGKDKGFKDHLLRFLNYFFIGIRCVIHKKPIAIVGLEVGKTSSVWLRIVEKILLKKAKLLVVRNENSLSVVKSYGINNAICTADSVFAMEKNVFEDCIIDDSFLGEDRKKLFVHVNPYKENNRQIIEKIIPVLNEFLKTHGEYDVLLGTDQYNENQKDVILEVSSKIKCDNIYINIYDNPVALCKVLDNVDCIITTKLHVGIVGARLGKSVISFSGHTEKIERLYEQLGEKDRTMPLSKFDAEKALDMLEKYHDIPINVDENILKMAKSNFDMLGEFLKSL